MPNQNDPTQNPNPVNPPVDQPASQISPPVPPTIFPQSDLPPLPPAFQNMPETETISPTVGQSPVPATNSDSGSSAPPEISSVLPKAKKKFGGGRIIATILGLIVLVGGVGAGILLTQQPQLFQQKAKIACEDNSECSAGWKCVSGGCLKIPTSTCSVGQNEDANCTNTLNGQSCPGKKTRFCQNGQWGSYSGCYDIADSCPTTTTTTTGGGTQTCCPRYNTPGSINTCTGAGPNECNINTSQCNLLETSCPDHSTLPLGPAGGSEGAVTQTVAVCEEQIVHTSTSYTVGSLYNSSNCYVNHYWCPDKTGAAAAAGCSDQVVASGVRSASFSKSCGVEQIDVGCSACGYGATSAAGGKFISKDWGTPCSGGTTTQTLVAPSCLAVNMYSSAWGAIPVAERSSLTAGATVNFCVAGSASSGTFDKARFTINGTTLAETTAVRPGSTDFCQIYEIPAGVTTFNVSAQIHHATEGWF